MKKSSLIAMVAILGMAVGAGAVEMDRAAAPPVAYMVVEYDVTDRAAFQAYLKGANALSTSRIFLARHAKATTLAGEPPKWVGILKYPSLEDALAFERSPQYQALIPTREQGTKWRAYVVEGLPD